MLGSESVPGAGVPPNAFVLVVCERESVCGKQVK